MRHTASVCGSRFPHRQPAVECVSRELSSSVINVLDRNARLKSQKRNSSNIDLESLPKCFKSTKHPTALHFSFNEMAFRPLRKEIIEAAMAKFDCCVYLPAGAGKSLCYMMPACLDSGLTIVISPLKALMLDQHLKCEVLGMNSRLLNSSMRSREIEALFEEFHLIDTCCIDILFTTPEQLQTPRLETISESLAARSPHRLLAVECVSQEISSSAINVRDRNARLQGQK